MSFFTPKVGTPAYYAAHPNVTKAIARAAGSAVRKSLKQSKSYKLRTHIRHELKYVENMVLNNNVVPAAGWVGCINSVAEGTDYTNRLGRKLNGRYIQIDAYFSPPTTNPNLDTCLLNIVYDRQPNNATAGYSDIFDTTTVPIGLMFRQLAKNQERFKIVRTWVVGPMNQNTPTSGARIRSYYAIPKSKSQCRYIGTAATVPETGAWLVTVASFANTAAAATACTATIACRFAFIDL